MQAYTENLKKFRVRLVLFFVTPICIMHSFLRSDFDCVILNIAYNCAQGIVSECFTWCFHAFKRYNKRKSILLWKRHPSNNLFFFNKFLNYEVTFYSGLIMQCCNSITNKKFFYHSKGQILIAWLKNISWMKHFVSWEYWIRHKY